MKNLVSKLSDNLEAVILWLLVFVTFCLVGCSVKDDGTIQFNITGKMDDSSSMYVINPSESEDVSQFKYKLTADNFIMYFDDSISTSNIVINNNYQINFDTGCCIITLYNDSKVDSTFIFSDYKLETVKTELLGEGE